MSKKVILLEARRAPKRRNGEPVPDKFIGVLACTVPEGTAGAFHYSGVTTLGKTFSRWQIEADVCRGYLRWVDVIQRDVYTDILLYIESDKFLFRITLPYDATTLRTVANSLAGLADAGTLHDTWLNVSYNVWQKKKADGSPVVGENGQALWAYAVNFGDVIPLVPLDEMRDFQQKNGLEWGEVFDSKKNKMVPDPSAEMRYWMRCVIGVQQFLMQTENYLPFAYNSITAQANPHPLGFGNLTEGERRVCEERYRTIAGQYIFPWSNEGKSADDIFGGDEAPTLPAPSQPTPPPPPTPTTSAPVSTLATASDPEPFAGLAAPATADLPF